MSARQWSNRALIGTGTAIIIFLAAVAFFGPLLAPNDPLHIDYTARLEGCSSHYPLGTDHLGRCVLSRILAGARITIGVSISVTILIVGVGLIVGYISGVSGGWVDGLIMRIVDIFLAFPSLVFVLAVVGITGPSLGGVMIGAGLAWWALYARLVRGLILSAKEKDFVMAGKAVGTGWFKLTRRYILPQILPPVLVMASLEAGAIITALAGLSFLGLGIQPPSPEWGAMLNEARQFMSVSPRLIMAPGLAVCIAVMGFNLLGEGFRDLFQVKEIYRG